MNLTDFNNAKALQDDIAKINQLQAALGVSGAKLVINLTQSDGKTILKSHADLDDVLAADLDGIATTAKTSLDEALTTLKTTKQSAFDALGEA